MTGLRLLSKIALSAAVISASALVGMTPGASPAQAAVELNAFSNRTTDVNAVPYTAAGGHPDRNVTDFSIGGLEVLNGTYVRPPLGFIGNPAAAPRCPLSKIGGHTLDGTMESNDCPLGSQVGMANVTNFAGGVWQNPLVNLPPERGYPAQFGFRVSSTPTVISVFPLPRTESYGLAVGTPNIPKLGVQGFISTFCGYGVEGDDIDPDGAGSDPPPNPFKCKSPAGFAGVPFLSNPVDCSETEPTWSIAVDSIEHAGALRDLGIPDLSDPDWATDSELAPPVTGCNDPALAEQFKPTISTTSPPGGAPFQADQPTGLRVALEFPQSNDPTDKDADADPSLPQAPPPKDITVKLPAGLAISPSSAEGLGACSDQASDPAGDQVHYDTTEPVTCPDSAKIGSAMATSPLLAQRDPQHDTEVIGPEPIPGDVYLLKPHTGDLPLGGDSDGKFRLLIQLENERYGVNFKLPGIAIADKQTGQITTVFTDNPQLPASHLTVDLKSGPRAPLATPVTCGNFETTSNFVPWSTPGTPNANPTASLNVGSGPNGTACANTPGQRPFAPALSAGTESSKAGAHSPFVMKLTRNDGEQELSSLDLTTPKGFSATLAGVPYCSDAAIASASSRSGLAEQASPSCPGSQVGTIRAGAGPGSNPYYANGKAYLAGPYKGAPLSFAFITPAVAGPFDLGNVVVRAAAYVNPETAQVTVKTDPLPQIIDGVPLRLRSITARIDRSNFTLNPTNCEPMSVNATVGSANGATANPSNGFQVGSCKDLGFKPDLKLSLKGDTKRSGHPALKAVLNYPKGNYANIAKAVVSLPHSEFLAQNHIKTVCTRVQYAADQCPAGSIYGFVTATTPLLDAPLSGPLYLRSSSNPLPDLVAALHGQIDVDLVGRIDSKNGGIRTTFDAVPDAPVSKFVLTMQGGKKGLLENSKNLCASVNKADVRFTAQNGKTANSTPVLTNSCKKKTAKKGKGKGKAHKVGRRLLSSFGF